ncbi:uncharacterized protein [Neodiprion pinetum]|uniref:Uncharacterized protein LOC107221248 isoform X1 n=1 Tax=Neodiprion lecontei TaxID=441921 RepID=A0A6J0BLX3_NEOLC|nr:uncharacterized protein LOC107221248 isoform X1 [Neodiprion lecontei]XP_046468912.1 uncharacterized protein LOC124212658 isoform X1 [Neodiprion pinetum]XP_046468913.1 uncharacterized protein LOC124212658 isoform X1 [Neodiprion pinetum]XP_046468914.1 uncharacterized protein LOC124212658 isoform X1 [Neodiprion pinetum]XP_046468915.1 uncharacterized protein LOC124212658 isoform X1 [Neodiprion pinetum]XP_046468916.1 uncharacterized protein LOC124212658 isoform X1 [Neodiprion pinetum]XP_0465882
MMLCWLQSRQSSNEAVNSKNQRTGLNENNGDPLRMSTTSILSELESAEVGEITERPDYENLSTSAVLHYCKCKILRPYLRLLGVMGLRPTSGDDIECSPCYSIFANLHTFQVLIFMCIGYVLQYTACFRRDRGFCYTLMRIDHELVSNTTKELQYERICYGSIAFSYAIPSILHLSAYLYAVYLFRIRENEQLQNLMERAFLMSSDPSDRGSQKRLVRILWLFIVLSIIWMIIALITVNLMMARGIIVFQWLHSSPDQLKTVLKFFLIVCTLWHDMVQGTIITSYCLQGQLLMSHLYFLRTKLLQHTLAPLDWMKEISEFKKLLKYFNDDFGPAVCIYTVVNFSWAAAGILWLLKYDNVDVQSSPIIYISIINVSLWVVISLAPFIQAARLTSACSTIQGIGHEIRVRPFVYQDTPGSDLDTILLYASSLNMCARLFRVPITGRYLLLALTVGSIVMLILGQCHFLSGL